MDCLVSIIIRTKNEGKLLWRVLKALEEQDFSYKFEVIVVDSGSTDNTLEIARNYNVRIIQIKPEDFTYGYGLNVGAAAAKGKYLVNLAGHAIPANNQYLSLIVSNFQDEKVAGVYGRDIAYPGCCPGETKDVYYGYPMSQTYPRVIFSSANGSIRKDLWEKVPYDEKISAAEDLLWAIKVGNLGFTITYMPEAVVHHSHSASLKPVYRRCFNIFKGACYINRLEEVKRLEGAVKEFLNWFKKMEEPKEILRWFITQSIDDLRFAVWRRYKFYWFPYIPIYRATQTLAMQVAIRKEVK